MSFGIGLVIVILLFAALLLGRAGSGGFAALFFLSALALFIATPMGDGLPGHVVDFMHSVSDATDAVQGGGK